MYYLSPEVVNAVVDERRRDSLRAGEARRLLREAGVERAGRLNRLGYRLSQAVGGLLVAAGQRLMRDELPSRMQTIEPSAIRRA